MIKSEKEYLKAMRKTLRSVLSGTFTQEEQYRSCLIWPRTACIDFCKPGSHHCKFKFANTVSMIDRSEKIIETVIFQSKLLLFRNSLTSRLCSRGREFKQFKNIDYSNIITTINISCQEKYYKNIEVCDISLKYID